MQGRHIYLLYIYIYIYNITSQTTNKTYNHYNKQNNMGKILKKGKVVILLSGRYAGKKAIIVKTFDEGFKQRKFPCALVAGMKEGPRKVTKSMGKKKVEKNVGKIKPFIKYVNYTHCMPTRYQVDLDLQKVVLGSDEINEDTKKSLRETFKQRFMNQGEAKSDKARNGTKFFYQKLNF